MDSMFVHITAVGDILFVPVNTHQSYTALKIRLFVSFFLSSFFFIFFSLNNQGASDLCFPVGKFYILLTSCMVIKFPRQKAAKQIWIHWWNKMWDGSAQKSLLSGGKKYTISYLFTYFPETWTDWIPPHFVMSKLGQYQYQRLKCNEKLLLLPVFPYFFLLNMPLERPHYKSPLSAKRCFFYFTCLKIPFFSLWPLKANNLLNLFDFSVVLRGSWNYSENWI